MTAVKIICTLLGIAFLFFGYAICFRRTFDLIDGFRENFANGRKNEEHAFSSA